MRFRGSYRALQPFDRCRRIWPDFLGLQKQTNEGNIPDSSVFYLTAAEGTSKKQVPMFCCQSPHQVLSSPFTGVIGALKHPLPILSTLYIFACVCVPCIKCCQDVLPLKCFEEAAAKKFGGKRKKRKKKEKKSWF